MANILAVLNDPGGTNAWVPVLSILGSKGHSVHAIAGTKYAGRLCGEHGIALSDHQDAPESHFKRYGPHVLATGTSWASDVEYQYRRLARQFSIPSAVIVDHWCNYQSRFSCQAESGRREYPDLIAVADARMRDEMVAADIPAKQIEILGQPHLDRVYQYRSYDTAHRRKTIRREYGIAPSTFLLTFVTEPVEAHHGNGMGYTETDVLTEFLKSLAPRTNKLDIALILKIHPKEDPRDYDPIVRKWPTIRIKTDAVPGWNTIIASDVVVGISSMLLLESVILGRPTLSLQPGLLKKDALISNSLGASFAVYRREDIAPTVNKILLDEGFRKSLKARADRFYSPANAAEHIAERVLQLANPVAAAGASCA